MHPQKNLVCGVNVGVNVTPCNWGVLCAPNAGVSMEFDKESSGANAILCTYCEDFNRLGVLNQQDLNLHNTNQRFDLICLLFSHH